MGANAMSMGTILNIRCEPEYTLCTVNTGFNIFEVVG